MIMKKIAVTGGAGFIGSHLVERLVNEGHNVSIVDDLSTGNINNLIHVKDKITFYQEPITNTEVLKKILKDVEIVYHLAAIPSVIRSLENPIESHTSNATGTLSILEACRNAKVKRVIYASSSSVYGDTPTLPKVETMVPLPKSPYAVSKLMGEYYCKVYAELYGMECVILRYFNVFGPRQNPHSQYAAVIPKFVIAMLQNKKPVIYGDGTQTRDFTYVENVVHACLLASTAKNFSREGFNIAMGQSISLNNLVGELNKILGTKIQPVYTENRQGDIHDSLADIHKAQQHLGYKPIVTFQEGLKKVIDHLKNETAPQ